MLFVDNSDALNGLSPIDNAAGVTTIAPALIESNVGAAPASQLLRIEAEDMLLDNYRIENIDFASGRSVASFAGRQQNESGSASAAFTGSAGLYDVVVGYFDEAEGHAGLDPLLNGQSLGSFKLDQNLGSNLATSDTFVRRTVGSQISLQAGDMFSLLGFEDANEHARVDYVEFIQVGGTLPAQTRDAVTSQQAVRINAGGGRYTDKNGQTWEADRFFEDGNTSKTDSRIWGTPNDPLYQSGRYAKTMDYHIPVANGVYNVDLHFAEVQSSGRGDRTFNIEMEGNTLSNRFDIYGQTGDNHQAVQKGFKSIVVTDGILDISLEAVQNLAQLSAIEVIATDWVSPRNELVSNQETIRVNSGGESYVDSKGQTWLADSFFEDGWTDYKDVSIWDSYDDTLYRSERYAKTLDYSVAVANGTYNVNLLFAELQWSGNGRRTFDVEVEGQAIAQSLDIHKEVGKFKAYNRQINSVVVTDGRLDLSLTGIKDKAKLSGFEIEFVSSDIETQPSSGSLLLPEESDNTPSNNQNTNAAPLNSGANIRFVSPNGNGNGSSWQQASSIFKLDRLIEQSSPGDEIWIAGDLGNYDLAGRAIAIDNGGSGAKPVYIRGMASRAGGSDTPLLVGDRAENWSPGKKDGTEVFRLLNGANHLHFDGIDFKNVGNGAFRLGGDLNNIVLEDIKATNVRRFIENYAANDARTASVSNLTVRDVDINGFSKSAIRLQYDSNNILIEDVNGDSQQQDGDNFAMGVHLSGTVNNVVHRRVTMKNAVQRKGKSDYWNADGFVTDWGTHSITYEDTFASGNTDGGYDLKSKDTLLVRAGAAGNKRNFRIWRSVTMIDVSSDDPILRGGTGTIAHVHVLGNEGNLTVQSGTFSGDKNIDNIIFDVDDKSSLVVENASITDNRYQLYTVGPGKIELKNINR